MTSRIAEVLRPSLETTASLLTSFRASSTTLVVVLVIGQIACDGTEELGIDTRSSSRPNTPESSTGSSTGRVEIGRFRAARFSTTNREFESLGVVGFGGSTVG
ncbi:MAG TPA: hypothetical protein PK020_18200 [Ilumatobacteraceae bacterium]|nr:hypothetical protein [Acidimicrobiaceae bacterium]HQZ36365.1 hypothetical protein [Ilumatobacteraceae bacterium]